jgi:integrase
VYNERASHRRPTTVARDDAVLNHWVVPAFGNRALSSITPSDVRLFVSSMEDAKLAPRTVRSHYGVFRALMSAAIVEDLIAVTPCRGVRLPEVRKTAKPIASVEDVVRLANEVPAEYAPAIYLAALGLRMQEVCGLKVKGIDFLRRILTVELTVNEIEARSCTAKERLSRPRGPFTFPARLSKCSRST